MCPYIIWEHLPACTMLFKALTEPLYFRMADPPFQLRVSLSCQLATNTMDRERIQARKIYNIAIKANPTAPPATTPMDSLDLKLDVESSVSPISPRSPFAVFSPLVLIFRESLMGKLEVNDTDPLVEEVGISGVGELSIGGGDGVDGSFGPSSESNLV